MPRDADQPLPLDPLDWRPMVPLVTRRPVELRDPIVEPLWSGVRVIAHLAPGDVRVRLIDAFGVDLTGSEAELAALLEAAVDADDAIIDMVLTDEATRGGQGAATITEPRSSIGGMLLNREPGVEIVRRDERADPVTALVGVDLLRLEGRSLLDLPLLERKRLLESVIQESERVRVSVHARPPVDPWVATWKAAGLRGGMLKASNGRYVPGGRTVEWRAVTRVAGRR